MNEQRAGQSDKDETNRSWTHTWQTEIDMAKKQSRVLRSESEEEDERLSG